MTPTDTAAPPPATALMDFYAGAVDDTSSWRIDALCGQTDPELFFPPKGESVKPAKRVCSACPVIAECLEWALEHNEDDGVWGGTSARERRAMRGKTRPRTRSLTAVPRRRRRAAA